MGNFRLDRRTVIRGAGSIAIALPFMEIMGEKALAAPDAAKRYITFYTPGGTVIDDWRPKGTETNFQFGSILQPLEAVKSKVMIVDGMNMKVASGEQHIRGLVALLTGTRADDAKNGFSAGPSIDQILAKRLSQGKKFKSLEMAVRWATGKTHGKIHGFNVLNFEDAADPKPIPPRIDPQDIWQSVFGTLVPPGEGGGDAASSQLLMRDKSILDYVDRRYVTLMKKLGTADQKILEAHLTKIRELEKSLSTGVGDSATSCKKPTRVDTSKYNPRTGLNSGDSGEVVDSSTDESIPLVGKFMMDMIVMAMSCDLTGVATMQWSDTEAKHQLPWLKSKGINQHLHYYEHDGGYRPKELAIIHNWYASQFAYLVNALSEVKLGDKTLLDESVLFWGSELSHPADHSNTDMPFVLAGNGGGLRTGRYMKFNGVENNKLLVSLFNLFGDTRNEFGKPGFSTGALNGLT